MKKVNDSARQPVMEFSDVVLDFQSASTPLSFTLRKGDFAFLRASSLALVALGIREAYAGEIKVFGEAWEAKSARKEELDRRRIGYVADPDSEITTEWVGNLDVDENVILGTLFDRSIGSKAVYAKMEELASRLGWEKGVPSSRPDSTSAADLLRAQWIRAFMPEDLALVILENPLEGALRKFTSHLMELAQEFHSNGVVVIWVAEERPDFEKLGFVPEFEF